MIPTSFAGLESQLSLLLLVMIRPGAAFMAAPFFSAAQIPVQLRVLIALAVGFPALSLVETALPAEGLLSLMGLMMVIAEVVAGLAIGFALQIAFSSSLLAGELISSAVGLSFAASVDPASGQGSPVIGTIISILATFLLLTSGGHLIFIETVHDSYLALPPGQAWLSFEQIDAMVRFGGQIFLLGFAIALPVVAAMILVQLLLGLLSRSAPQLNMFSVSLPATVLIGLALLAFALPTMADGLATALDGGLEQARSTAGVADR